MLGRRSCERRRTSPKLAKVGFGVGPGEGTRRGNRIREEASFEDTLCEQDLTTKPRGAALA